MGGGGQPRRCDDGVQRSYFTVICIDVDVMYISMAMRIAHAIGMSITPLPCNCSYFEH